MKKNLLLLAGFLMALPVFAAVEVVTKGNGKTYSFQALSKIENSGVSVENGSYVVQNNITIANGDNFILDDNTTIKMGDDITVRFEGGVDMKLESGTTVTRNLDNDKPKGFVIASPSPVECCNLSMEFASMKCVTVSSMNIYECSFKYSNGAYGGALALGTTGAVFNVKNCEFISNTVPGISCAANFAVGLTVDGCNFEDNNSSNTNKPQINITVGGDKDIIIRNSTFLGAKRNKVGGIGISNFAGIKGTNNVFIENNIIKYHRFGIGLTYGEMNVFVKNNMIEENCYEEDPMMGGSGISAQDVTELMALYAEGNTISGNLWGITLIGCKTANIGKTDDLDAADYNPGKNVFKNNGNNNILYDLYNNGPYTVYAQGNTWNVDQQTAEKIETVIFHKADDPKLGEVFFMPAGTGGVESVSAGKICFNSELKQIAGLKNIEVVEVYSASGTLVAKCPVVDGVAVLEKIPEGFYLVNAGKNGILKVKL